jgi:DNA invertase Pin-like site-specific DNA recombinase
MVCRDRRRLDGNNPIQKAEITFPLMDDDGVVIILPMSSSAVIVSYLRVSTARQGIDGYGVGGQRTAIAEFAKRTGATIAREFVEVESGRKNERPELAKALAHAKRIGATLVIAKLDRLSRNVAFLAALMDSGIDFTAVDNPNANRLTIHILAAVAEDEARRISERTKAGLAEARRCGRKLGSARPGHWKGREDARAAGLASATAAAALVNRSKAFDRIADLLPTIVESRKAGKSLAAIAAELNSAGQVTPRGGQWNPIQVSRALSRTAAR